jgi:hypothetical protein
MSDRRDKTPWQQFSYEKFLLAAVLVALIGWVGYLTYCVSRIPDMEKEFVEKLGERQPRYPDVQPVDERPYEQGLAAIRGPSSPQTPFTPPLFIPGTRVLCHSCQRPISIEGYRERKPCPFCGEVRPRGFDEDGDGMPDAWEQKHGLDPDDPGDAQLDPDEDGFRSVEEYVAGTDPKDTEDSPLPKLLAVKKVGSTRFPLVFKSAVELPDGTVNFGLNEPGWTYFVKLGQDVKGYKVVKYEKKMARRIPANIPVPQDVDVSELVLERDGKQVTLVRHEPYIERKALLVFSPIPEEFPVTVGDTIEVRGLAYEIRSLDTETGTVTIRRVRDGRDWVLQRSR